MDALHRELLKICGNGFLISKTGKSWDWASAPPGSIDKFDYDLAGTMPLRQKGDQEPSYAPGTELSDAYETVLFSIKRAHPTGDMKKIQNQLAFLQAKKSAEFYTYQALKAKEAAKPGFNEEEWKEGTDWVTRLTMYDDEIEECKNDLKLFKVNDPIYNKIRGALDSKQDFLIRVQDKKEVPPYSITANGPQWAQMVAGGKGNRIEIKLSSADINDKKRQGGGRFQAGVKLFSFIPFGIKGGISGSEERMKIEKESTEISIAFEAIETFQVSRGDWFNLSFLKKVADEDRWGDGHTTQQMLGRDGILHSVVTGFVAAYRPSLTITASKSANAEVKKKLEGNLGLSIGPVFF